MVLFEASFNLFKARIKSCLAFGKFWSRSKCTSSASTNAPTGDVGMLQPPGWNAPLLVGMPHLYYNQTCILKIKPYISHYFYH